jgi:hydrogenase maturation protease
MSPDTLVIAYGNPLRGDDGVGPAAGEVIERWQLPHVQVRIVPQLVPELIDDIAHAGRVLFIDAADRPRGARFIHGIVGARRSPGPLGHHETPANLLALLHDLEGRTPEAWLLTISASSFAHGESITPRTADNLQAALAWVRHWIAEPSGAKPAEPI